MRMKEGMAQGRWCLKHEPKAFSKAEEEMDEELVGRVRTTEQKDQEQRQQAWPRSRYQNGQN